MTSRNRELADIMSEAAAASSGQVLTTNTSALYWETAAGGGLFKGENGTINLNTITGIRLMR